MKRNHKTSKLLIVASLFFSFMMLCGFDGWGRNSIKLDFEDNPIYESYNIGNVIDSKDVDIHKGHDIVTKGIITEIAKNNKSFNLATSKESTSFVKVEADKKYIKDFNPGDIVTVFGKIIVDKKTNRISYIDASIVSKSKGELNLKSDYYFTDGREYKIKDGYESSIANGKVKYYIPSEWRKVETQDFLDISNGNDGYCYNLNRLKGNTTAESFCIYYFDKASHIEYDSDFNDNSGLEEAIISNISSHDDWLREWLDKDFYNKSITTSFGSKMDIYTMNYKNHHLEYIFIPTKDGLCVMLYLYSGNYNSAEDIMYVIRTLRIAE